MLKIKNITLKHGLALAPMAGVTDRAFRTLCKEYGAEYMVSEMISAKGLHYHDKKTEILADFSEGERPVAVQLFGKEEAIVAEAVETVVRRFHPDVVDLNMGCPMPKIVNNGEGSAMMRDLPQAARVISAAVRAAGDTPLTVKFRTGWDASHRNAPELAHIAEECGAAALCIHGRTREQLYRPGVDLETIARVKAAVSIPVFGNGDVDSADAAREMIGQTGVDGIMIGRGARGNPFLFAQITDVLEGRPPREISRNERLDTALRHVSLLIHFKGQRMGILESRKHLGWYLHGIPGAAEARAKINASDTEEQLQAIINELRE